MNKLQFRILYREFLFRIIDLDLLAPEGDMSKLLGQFAALLLIVGLWILLPVATEAGAPPSEMALMVTWAAEHFLIATTMLVVGLFAVLSWESMFPDRRDVLVLTPLPIRARTLFLAKIAAVSTALALTIGVLNVLPGSAAGFSFAGALKMPPPTYDAAILPVAVGQMRAVLDRDLLAARDPDGFMKLGRNAGISVGVWQHGARNVFSFGTARSDSIFEIASITKTFTGLLLARMTEEGLVRLDEPVRDLLPPGTVAKPPGTEITLLDLSTHHSGLPGMPDNFRPSDSSNPYKDYRAANLYDYLNRHGVAKSGHPSFVYSNLGVGLLGQALANRAHTSYPDLLRQEITGPLGMNDTVVKMRPELWDRFIQGHSGNGRHNRVPAWDLDALMGAGGIRSTAGDMLNYLAAQLHPATAGALASALEESHRLRDEVAGQQRIALGWIYRPEEGVYGHNGGTAGFSSCALFDPKHDCATVVLINTGPSLSLDASQLADHILARLVGERAISLAPPVVQGTANFRNVMRAFGAYWLTLFASGTFMFCFVLTLQGLAQLLPRQLFLRLSSFLQLACFCLLLTIYFFQVPFAGPEALMEGARWIQWLPSYCFLAAFQQLNGALPPLMDAMNTRAWAGLALSIAGAGGSYLICYFRTLRMIAEQPDIQPAARRVRWLPKFGNALQTAVGQFSVRTLLRSRQHRVILSFYLGVMIGLAVFFSRAPVLREQIAHDDAWHQQAAGWIVSSILIMIGAVMGARIVFSIPLDLRANWIFRIVRTPAVDECQAASRRALIGMAVLPVWLTMSAFFFWAWPWRVAAGHLIVLALLAAITAELALHGFHKIPFTCSYLPGKSYIHMAAIAFLGFLFLVLKGYPLERSALDDGRRFVVLVATLTLALAVARWRTAHRSRSEDATLQFEEEQEPVIHGLGLYRDGALPVPSQQTR